MVDLVMCAQIECLMAAQLETTNLDLYIHKDIRTIMTTSFMEDSPLVHISRDMFTHKDIPTLELDCKRPL